MTFVATTSIRLCPYVGKTTHAQAESHQRLEGSNSSRGTGSEKKAPYHPRRLQETLMCSKHGIIVHRRSDDGWAHCHCWLGGNWVKSLMAQAGIPSVGAVSVQRSLGQQCRMERAASWPHRHSRAKHAARRDRCSETVPSHVSVRRAGWCGVILGLD